MRIIAGKPYKVRLKQNGTTRERWQVKLWSKDGFTDRQTPIAQKTYKTRTEAIDNIPALVKSYSKTQGRIKSGARMRFRDLVLEAEKSFYSKATIRQGRKTQGVRSYKSKQSQLKFLKEYFEDFKITSISESDLFAYREWRMKHGSRRGKDKAGAELSLSTVNRELSTLRKLLSHAFGQGWIERNPFAGATNIIDGGAEVERTRILSNDEEVVLLALCEPGVKSVPTQRKRKDGSTINVPVATGNPELRAAVLFALDCGLRQGEILSLQWKYVDLDNGIATVKGTHTKTQKSRQVGLSDRLVEALRLLPSFQAGQNVFNTNSFKRSWNTARRLAGLTNLHFHDLRGTAASRMINQGVPLAVVGKYLGHENYETTLKYYVRPDSWTIENVRERMNAYNESDHL